MHNRREQCIGLGVGGSDPPGTTRRGVLVAVEGIDGAGKSVLVAALTDHVRGMGMPVRQGHSPSRTSAASRELEASSTSGRGMSADRELALFREDFRHVRDHTVAPGLSSGEVVVMDRYVLSSAAYQGVLNGTPPPEEILAGYADFMPVPDVTVLLDLPVRTALRRVGKRGAPASRFERPGHLKRVRGVYVMLAAFSVGGTVAVVDARAPVARVLEQSVHVLSRRMGW